MAKKKTRGGLGFRNMHEFNVALVAKQGWRLMNCPESLVGRLYRARYYPNNTFLNAKVGNNPSYIWRSIIQSQDLIMKGACRRVGEGKSVNILMDPWLPDDTNPYVQTKNAGLIDKMVSSLMVQNQDQWNVTFINDMFEERDANLILSIPIRSSDPDTWFWRKERMGRFTVKSAYADIQDNKYNAHSSDNSGFWRKLWNLKVPPKVKHFLWRSVTGCLPTKVQLRSKRVDVNNLCPLCNTDAETVIHSLVTCSFAQASIEALGVQVGSLNHSTFTEWLQGVFDRCKGDDIQQLTMLCWSLWKNRNELVWNQRSADVYEVVQSAKITLDQWRSAQEKSFNTSLGFMNAEDGDECWRKPSVNKIKINTDATIFDKDNCYSYAMVARDHNGGLVEAVSRCSAGNINPVMAEAMGVREALSWVKDHNWPSVIVETDCLVFIQAVRCSAVNLSYLGRIVEECKQLLIDLKDRELILKFVKRSANKVAHFLARYSSSIADRVWQNDDANLEFLSVMSRDLIT